MKIEEGLLENISDSLTSGTCLAILFTNILRYQFGIEPDAAFGYSLGESSMMSALKVWQGSTHDNEKMDESPLFHDRIGGKKHVVRENWNLSPNIPITKFGPITCCSPNRIGFAKR